MSTGARTRRRVICLYACIALLTLVDRARSAPPSQHTAVEATVAQFTPHPQQILLRAARIFDGQQLHDNAVVLVSGSTIAALGAADQVRAPEALVRDLGEATILPGFIELHGHVALHHIPHEIILRHGVTTVRDVGGPLLPPSGGDGRLRLLTAGPIMTAPGGYSIPVFGSTDVAVTVDPPRPGTPTCAPARDGRRCRHEGGPGSRR